MIIQRLQLHLQGQLDTFDDIALDLPGARPFTQSVYHWTRCVPPGQVTTYSTLAALTGKSGAARAVGQIMAKNPVPLIIPCHRVLASDGGLCGFSAAGEVSTKLRLLTIEGVDLTPIASTGVHVLQRNDPRLNQVIRRIGPYRLLNHQRSDPFPALVETIIHQQVSMKVGATIFKRLKTLLGVKGSLSPEQVLSKPEEKLRQAGLSKQKASYIIDLAKKSTDGTLQLDHLERMDDEPIIQKLIQVKGIGRWSAEMFLMFHLGRINVLPVDDLGLQKAAQKLYGLKSLPSPATLHRLAKAWHPYCSIATWYLWRSLEAGGL